MADVTILATADLLDVALAHITGNDAVLLVQAPTTYLDVIGQIGYDPPIGCWCYPYPGCDCSSTISTLDAVLRRSADYQGGFVIPTNPFTFDPQYWAGFPASDFSGLGFPGYMTGNIFTDGFENGDTNEWDGVVP
jgi:hypothetical protein